MEFKTAEEANHALNSMNGHPFDSKHIFLINHFTDVEKYSDLDEVFVEPEPEQYQPRVCSLGTSIIHGNSDMSLTGASTGVAC